MRLLTAEENQKIAKLVASRHVVESILEPDPPPYVKSLSPDRFERRWDWPAAQRQAQHYYETYYDLGH